MAYVSVPVPEDRVQEVYALLAGEAPGEPVGNGAAEWAQEAIVRMYRESPPAMRAFLDHLCDHAGQEFTLQQMADAIDRTAQQTRGVLGAFGHRVSSRYRWTSWPILSEWDSEERTVLYEMSPAVAQMIRSARSG